MRTRYNLIWLLVPMLVFPTETNAQKYTKQKNIKKAYHVNADAGIDIDNAYGNVYVTTWTEDKIELDILIKVASDKEDWAVKKLNDIDVDITALKHLVTAKTNFANGAGKSSTKNNSIEVNYTIKIPRNGSVTVDNKYGQIITTDLFGATHIECKYGKIALGKLNSGSNVIDIAYCGKSTIDYAKSARISADYSGLTMTDFGTVALNADYTDVHFENGDNMKFDCNYGNLKYGKVGNLEGSGDYLSIGIAEVSNNLKISTSYSKLSVDQLTAKAGNVVVQTGYTSVDIGYSPNYTFDFDVKVKYANFRHSGDLDINNRHETSTSKSYSGYHKKQGVNKVVIVSDYGNVNLNKNQ